MEMEMNRFLPPYGCYNDPRTRHPWLDAIVNAPATAPGSRLANLPQDSNYAPYQEVTMRKEMLEKFESTEEEQLLAHEQQMFDEIPIDKEVEKKYVDESSTPLVDEKPEEFAVLVNNNDSSHIIQFHIAATIASAEKNHYAIRDSVTNLKKYMFENNLDSDVELKVTDMKIHELDEDTVEFAYASPVLAHIKLLENEFTNPSSFKIGPDRRHMDTQYSNISNGVICNTRETSKSVEIYPFAKFVGKHYFPLPSAMILFALNEILRKEILICNEERHVSYRLWSKCFKVSFVSHVKFGTGNIVPIIKALGNWNFAGNTQHLFSYIDRQVLSGALYPPCGFFERGYKEMEGAILSGVIVGLEGREAAVIFRGVQKFELSETVRKRVESIRQVMLLLQSTDERCTNCSSLDTERKYKLLELLGVQAHKLGFSEFEIHVGLDKANAIGNRASGYKVVPSTGKAVAEYYVSLEIDIMVATTINLVVEEQPTDAYIGISLSVHHVVKGDSYEDRTTDSNAFLAKLLTNHVEKTLMKQTVITSVYVVTYVGLREQIKVILENKGLINDDSFLFSAFCDAAEVTLASLRELVQAARGTMTWLGDCVKRSSSEKQPM
ncbi:dna-directed rna polymerase 3, chloroplastic [Nicotiana attenuata]|uniref:DNA-directed RNA polymerase n=1 Tax=Nicotiana attenuata TaxID=49451 RepID=A0A1J6JZP5_NICAT|nr:dna-directed rna polymerase 3, chloroplastic [Nicotiana attenuata]